MLALKSILSAVDQTPTLVFDEIDVGVGGRSGQVVGEKLWRLAEDHQVIVITHLPQIAAFADAHFRIEKHERAGRTVSIIQDLDETNGSKNWRRCSTVLRSPRVRCRTPGKCGNGPRRVKDLQLGVA